GRDRGERVEQRDDDARQERDAEGDPDIARPIGGDDSEERTHEHRRLEGDVRDATPLRHDAAEGCKRDRCREPERGCRHARTEKHLPGHAIASTGLRAPRRRVRERTSASAAITNSTSAWMIATRFDEIPACDCMYAPPCTNAPNRSAANTMPSGEVFPRSATAIGSK